MANTNPNRLSWHLRGSGRTQYMIEQVVQVIKDGQPYVQVVGRYLRDVYKNLEPRIIDRLNLEGIQYEKQRRFEYNVDGTKLTFHSSMDITEYNRGRVQSNFSCQFWDHRALWYKDLWE